MERGYAVVTDGRLYYETAGSGQAVVMIHGNGLDCRQWDAQFQTVARRRRVVRYDVRGFGKSSLPVEGHPYAHHDDLAALLEYLGIRQVHVIGSSMGSAIGADFVLHYPDMTSSLTSVGPWVSGYSSPATDEMQRELFERMTAIVREECTSVAIVHKLVAIPYYRRTLHSLPVEWILEICKDYTFWHYRHQDPIRPAKLPAAARTAAIKVPTLAVTAEYDLPPCVEVANLMERTVPSCRKVVMHDAGHIPNAERPEEFNRLALEFIDTL